MFFQDKQCSYTIRCSTVLYLSQTAQCSVSKYNHKNITSRVYGNYHSHVLFALNRIYNSNTCI